MANEQNQNEITYYVKGLHCASCEILIESKLAEMENIKSAKVSTADNLIKIKYSEIKPTVELLNKIFKDNGYIFSEEKFAEKADSIYKAIVIAGLIIAAFILINISGISAWINVDSNSTLPAFFLLGIFAGLSSCAALVGGIILSMSQRWLSLYGKNNSTIKKLQPHLMFNAGRLASYGILGAVLGGIGSQFRISTLFTSIIVILISIIMLILAMQMLGVKSLQKVRIAWPKFLGNKFANPENFSGKFAPALIGASTFFLPCGFTITAQGLALLSGNAWEGGLIMLLFALGTAPMLLAIGFSAIKFSSMPKFNANFAKVAGILILFFALFNINSQMNMLGLPSINDVFAQNSQINQQSNVDKDLPPIVDGKQIIEMTASAQGYSPKYFKVRTGVPVLWKIKDIGTSGCTNAVISRGLFDDEIGLTPGKTSVKEFTPQKAGKYKFSCWMGMISGIIEVK